MAKRIWDTSLFPPLFGRKLESDRQYTVVNTVLPRFPPPLNKVEVHPTLKNFSGGRVVIGKCTDHRVILLEP